VALLELAKIKETFESEDMYILHLEKARWPTGITCLSCGNRRISRIRTKGKTGKARQLYQCLEKSCRHQFSATTGTIFHDSHLPLSKWIRAIALLSESNDVTTAQLGNALGVQYKTAQHVAQRIRQALETGTMELQPNGSSIPQVEEPLQLKERGSSKGDKQAAFALDDPSKLSDRNRTPIITNMLNAFSSIAHITMRSPFTVAHYIIGKASPYAE